MATWNIESVRVRRSRQYHAAKATLNRFCADVVALQEIDGIALGAFADRDGNVALRDSAAFMNGFTGAGRQAAPECAKFDRNGDNAVDLPDDRAFNPSITGLR